MENKGIERKKERVREREKGTGSEGGERERERERERMNEQILKGRSYFTSYSAAPTFL